jgi:hypothetical protein
MKNKKNSWESKTTESQSKYILKMSQNQAKNKGKACHLFWRVSGLQWSHRQCLRDQEEGRLGRPFSVTDGNNQGK